MLTSYSTDRGQDTGAGASSFTAEKAIAKSCSVVDIEGKHHRNVHDATIKVKQCVTGLQTDKDKCSRLSDTMSHHALLPRSFVFCGPPSPCPGKGGKECQVMDLRL